MTITRSMENLRTGRPKNAQFQPLPWQTKPWRDKSKVLLLTGSAGGGKSRVAAEKVHAFMLKYPGATGIIGRKDKTSANKSIVPFMRRTIQGKTEWGQYRAVSGLFDYDNGSQLWVVGLRDEQQRENLRSIGQDGSVDIAWFEEANKLIEADHNEVQARMRGNAAGWRQIIYTTNPDRPDHFIKKMLIDDKQAATYYSSAKDNIYNPEDYLETLEGLTGVFYDRLCLGLWVQAEGAIYTEYDPAIHLVDHFDVEGVGRYIVSIDFGYIHPFVATLWYIDQNDIIYLYREIFQTGRLVEDHAKEIKRMTAGLPIEAYITDHDAEDRATLEKHLKIKTKPAYKGVIPGIQAVKARLRDKRLFIMRNALMQADMKLERAKRPTCTQEEISGYRWGNNEKPVKELDDGMDSLRYLVAYVDKISRAFSLGSVGVGVDNWAGRGEIKRPEIRY